MEGAWSGLVCEVIIADGGSEDETLEIADEAGCEIVRTERGRGLQVRAGAAAARGDWLLFLHADTVLETGWSKEAAHLMRHHPAYAAAFAFAFDDESRAARRAAFWVGVRCRILKLPYGDQGLLIARAHYDALGGYKAIALMEDVDIVRRIGPRRLRILKHRAVTSSEKYRRSGYTRRAARNLWLLARFYLGADPDDLARAYD